MDIVDNRTARVLHYLDALNRQSTYPTAAQVDAYGENPDRMTTKAYGLAELASLQLDAYRGLLSGQEVDEEFSLYLFRLGWAAYEGRSGVRLTKSGRALVRALNAPPSEVAEELEIVLRPDDRFAYAQLLNKMAQVPDATLIEPYLRLDQYIEIAELDNIRRYMVGPRLSVGERTALALAMRTRSQESRPELRASADLHDRYLLPAEEGQRGLMLGVSMNGVGRTVSTLVTLGEEATRALRNAHRALWDQAEVVTAPAGDGVPKQEGSGGEVADAE